MSLAVFVMLEKNAASMSMAWWKIAGSYVIAASTGFIQNVVG